LAIPPDYALYETYRLNYRTFIEDGLLAAREIKDWSQPYLRDTPRRILDWGCGTGRITRHLPEIFPGSQIQGCDINAAMIGWNLSHYGQAGFSVTGHAPPTGYTTSSFDLVYGFSVLTHIDMELQQDWLAELHRILTNDGILMITTHGNGYLDQLIPPEKRLVQQNGIYTRAYHQKGHRMVTTYHDPALFRKMLERDFTILEYHDGKLDPRRIGGQDLWILRKRR
jgi:ubiquinone/menaquinone biosynthesis C-methylase UbiE